MRSTQHTTPFVTITLTAVLCVVLAAPALAQRPSLGGLQTQINQNAADIDTAQSTADGAQSDADMNASDITVNSDAICTVAIAAGVCHDLPFCAGVCPKTAFVTSLPFPGGQLGGLPGADARCQNFATNAGLPGTYLAWLSDSSGSPASRFAQSSVPYVRVDGVQIADDWADLTDGSLDAPISLDETARSLNVIVWTGTDRNGKLSEVPSLDASCSDWNSTSSTGLYGGSDDTNPAWTDKGVSNCSSALYLYCFEQ